jgi:hypothetical protein
MTQSEESEARDEALDLERFVRQVRGLPTVAESEIDKLRGKGILKPSFNQDPVVTDSTIGLGQEYRSIRRMLVNAGLVTDSIDGLWSCTPFAERLRRCER